MCGNGQTILTKKVTTSHVNEAFNEELQVDFTYAVVPGKRREILNIIDTGTRFGERVIRLQGVRIRSSVRSSLNGFTATECRNV